MKSKPLTEVLRIPPYISKDVRLLYKLVDEEKYKIPGVSFLDKSSFKVDGFVEWAVNSVVLKVTDRSGSYAVKIKSRTKDLKKEFKMLDLFKKNGLLVPTPLEFVDSTTCEFPFYIMQYIDSKEESPQEFSDNVLFKLGESLAKLHRLHSAEYGEIIDLDFLKGSSNYSGKDLSNWYYEDAAENLRQRNLVKEPLTFYFLNAKATLERSEEEPVLIHGNISYDNFLHTQSGIHFLSPKGRFSHPMLDLASLILSLDFIDSKDKSKILDGYSSKKSLNEKELNSAIFIESVVLLDRISSTVNITEGTDLSRLKRLIQESKSKL